eukprot:g17123.t1
MLHSTLPSHNASLYSTLSQCFTLFYPLTMVHSTHPSHNGSLYSTLSHRLTLLYPLTQTHSTLPSHTDSLYSTLSHRLTLLYPLTQTHSTLPSHNGSLYSTLSQWFTLLYPLTMLHSTHPSHTDSLYSTPSQWFLLLYPLTMTQHQQKASCGSEGVGPRKSKYPMITAEQALSIVLQNSLPLQPCKLSLPQIGRLVLAEDVKATEPFPPFRASIMDGYAVRAVDGPGVFPVQSQVTAGDSPNHSLLPGHVAYITTGAAVPEGADAVVKVEDTEVATSTEGAEKVKILHGASPGEFIRPIGSDIKEGEVVLSSGQEIGPAELGLLAANGIVSVQVFPKPVVGVMSTGDELAEPDAPLKPGHIRDSNRCMLLAAVEEAGGKAVDLGIGSDSKETLRQAFRDAVGRCDVMVVSGGVSMGSKDFVKPLISELGDILFGRVHLKPGKPTTFAKVVSEGRSCLFFGLPGNPVSAMVCFHLFVVPAIRKLKGWGKASAPESAHRFPYQTVVPARLAHDFPMDPERPEFHRCVLRLDTETGTFVASSTGRQISSRLLSCRGADGLAYIPQAPPKGLLKLPRGTKVEVILLGALKPDLTVSTIDQDMSAAAAANGQQQQVQLVDTSGCGHVHGHGHGHGHGKHESQHGHSHGTSHGSSHESSHGASQGHGHNHGQSHGHKGDHELKHPGHGAIHGASHGVQSHDHGHSHGHGGGHHGKAGSSDTHNKIPPSQPSTTGEKKLFSVRVAVLTVSDRVSAGATVDATGPTAVEFLKKFFQSTSDLQLEGVETAVVPDESVQIQERLKHWADRSDPPPPHLVLTCGGTGFSPRDVTPEATSAILHRTAPGIVTSMLMTSLQFTPMAVLSRPAAGTRKGTLIINLPGSTKAVSQILTPLLPVLPHALRLQQEGSDPHSV